MVLSQALYRRLVEARPGVQIDVVAPPWSAPLLQRMPEVRCAIELPVAHGELALRRRRRLARSLRGERYDQAIVLPNSFKSALLPWFADIPLRTGWRGEMRYGLLNDLRLLDSRQWPTMAQRFVALGDAASAPPAAVVPAPQLVADVAGAGALAQGFGIDSTAPLLTLCPGAEFGPAKRWPVASFAAVARYYLAAGWQLVLQGSEADREVCAAIAAGAPGCVNLAGRTRLGEAIDLLSLSTAVVTNDSGLMHIAAALQRPLVAVYGPTSPDFTPPLDEAARVLTTAESCAPCFQRECPLGHHNCMRNLSAQQVLDALQPLLDESGKRV
ncbi:MAG: lipopolysaccharide heptosyltransferase II [Halioglobus sp.]